MSADILVVDDEEDIRRLIQGILEDEGYSVRQAATAEQAYARMEESIPSLVVLDIWLQQGDEDGLKILKHIKEDHPILPVLMRKTIQQPPDNWHCFGKLLAMPLAN